MPRNKPIHYNRGIIRRTPAGTWQAEINRALQRRRQNFPTEARAKAWINAEIALIDSQDAPLDAAQMREASKAFALLPEGTTLIEAVQHFARYTASVTRAVTLQDAADKFLDQKAADGLRPRSYATLRAQIRRLAKDLGARPMTALDAPALLDWLNANGFKGETRDNYRRTLANFFGWAQRMKYIIDLPTAGLTAPRRDQALPGIVTVAQAAAILQAALAHNPQLAPFLALGFFAGIRPAEAMRLHWEAITDKHIHIGPSVAKTRDQRYVALMSNLPAWLENHPQSGPILPVHERAAFIMLAENRAQAGVTDWPTDAARHSFATYHLALYQDAPRTAHEMGHTSLAMLYNHYRNLATKAQAEDYFSITPENVSRFCPEETQPQ